MAKNNYPNKGRGVSRLAEVIQKQMNRTAGAGGPIGETGKISGGNLVPDQLQQPVPLDDCQRVKGAAVPGEGSKVLLIWTAAGPVIIGEIE